MKIDILEVRKSKKYYVLIFDPNMFIPFVNGVKLKIINFILHIIL